MLNITRTISILIDTASTTSGDIMHSISQTLMIPVIIILTIFFIYSIIHCGVIVSEYYKRRKNDLNSNKVKNIIMDLNDNKDDLKNIKDAIKRSDLHTFQKRAIIEVIENNNLDCETQKSLAREIIEKEEMFLFKKLEKTDIIAKVAPAMGLMGTLIPLGPGLLALGMGDTQTLADNLIIAFDTTVLGMASASLAFIVSKFRRRWYMKDIDNLDNLIEYILGTRKC